ncbi:hypothetical protein [Tenebrionibacter intestinalis]|uniref:hypothetical protein n=1 Tax=Tenebrionibacter intestinalis TaxID=2799638 RepID=UPI0037D9AAA1
MTAELIQNRADASKLHRGLARYKGEEVGVCNVGTAKTALTDGVSELNGMGDLRLDFSGDKTRRVSRTFARLAG